MELETHVLLAERVGLIEVGQRLDRCLAISRERWKDAQRANHVSVERRRTLDRLLPAYCLLPTAYCLLPTALPLDSVLDLRRLDRVLQQAGDGHRADAAGHRRDGAGDLGASAIGDVADELASCRPRPGTRLMPTSMTMAPGLIQSPLTISGRPTAATRMSARAARRPAGRCVLRVGDGDRAVLAQQQLRHRLADDVGAADDDGVEARRGRAAPTFDQDQRARRRAGHEAPSLADRRAGRR